MRRLAVVLTTLTFVLLGASVQPVQAAPAAYAHPTASVAQAQRVDGKFTLHSLTNYGGILLADKGPNCGIGCNPPVGVCQSLGGTVADNAADSAVNQYRWDGFHVPLRLYASATCSGSFAWFDMSANSSRPNLGTTSVGNNNVSAWLIIAA